MGGSAEQQSFEIFCGFGYYIFEELSEVGVTLNCRSKSVWESLPMVTAKMGLGLFCTL